MARQPRSEKTVAVVIAEGAIVYVDDRSYGAGETLELPAAEAKALIEAGQASPGRAKRRGR